MSRILTHKIERNRNHFSNQHGLVEDQPFMECAIECALIRVSRETGLMILKSCPISLERLNEAFDFSLATELVLQVTYEGIKLTIKERAGDSRDIRLSFTIVS